MNTYILDIKRSKAYGKVLRKRFFDGYNGERVVTIYNDERECNDYYIISRDYTGEITEKYLKNMRLTAKHYVEVKVGSFFPARVFEDYGVGHTPAYYYYNRIKGTPWAGSVSAVGEKGLLVWSRSLSVGLSNPYFYDRDMVIRNFIFRFEDLGRDKYTDGALQFIQENLPEHL